MFGLLFEWPLKTGFTASVLFCMYCIFNNCGGERLCVDWGGGGGGGGVGCYPIKITVLFPNNSGTVMGRKIF